MNSPKKEQKEKEFENLSCFKSTSEICRISLTDKDINSKKDDMNDNTHLCYRKPNEKICKSNTNINTINTINNSDNIKSSNILKGETMKQQMKSDEILISIKERGNKKLDFFKEFHKKNDIALEDEVCKDLINDLQEKLKSPRRDEQEERVYGFSEEYKNSVDNSIHDNKYNFSTKESIFLDLSRSHSPKYTDSHFCNQSNIIKQTDNEAVNQHFHSPQIGYRDGGSFNIGLHQKMRNLEILKSYNENVSNKSGCSPLLKFRPKSNHPSANTENFTLNNTKKEQFLNVNSKIIDTNPLLDKEIKITKPVIINSKITISPPEDIEKIIIKHNINKVTEFEKYISTIENNILTTNNETTFLSQNTHNTQNTQTSLINNEMFSTFQNNFNDILANQVCSRHLQKALESNNFNKDVLQMIAQEVSFSCLF